MAEGRKGPVPVDVAAYVAVLSEVAGGGVIDVTHWPNGSVAQRAARELLRADLISDARVQTTANLAFRDRLVLTPEGALALVQWKEFLRARSWWARTLRVLYHWLLVIIGGVSGVAASRLWPG